MRDITVGEIRGMFGDHVPMLAVKLLFPEKSEPLTTDELREVLLLISGAPRVKPAPPKPREWWCLVDTKRDKRIPFAWSTSRESAAEMLGADSSEIIHVREVTD